MGQKMGNPGFIGLLAPARSSSCAPAGRRQQGSGGPQELSELVLELVVVVVVARQG